VKTGTPTPEPTLQPMTDFSEATFVYDGNGNMVEALPGNACGEFELSSNSRLNCISSSYVIDDVSTYYIGGYYELKVDGTTETETKYYTGPTGRFAMRVEGTLYWIFSDHLGSSSVILEEDGDVISRTTYTAFGEERDIWGVSSPTDYTYTGQRSYTDDFGLMFYNARWYDPYLNQFIQPDTLIPNPGNSADWNRYAYVLYNPMRYIDPTGHAPCFEDGYCPIIGASEDDLFDGWFEYYGVSITGNWKASDKWAILFGVQAVAKAFTDVVGFGNPNTNFAFRAAYGIRGSEKFNFEWGCAGCTGMAINLGTRHIAFRQMYQAKGSITASFAMFRNVTLVAHELFHAFENAMEITLANKLKYREARSTLPSHFTREGLAPPFMVWQQSKSDTPGEVFADMGVAWVFNKWGTDNTILTADMSAWMNNHMPIFIYKAISNQR